MCHWDQMTWDRHYRDQVTHSLSIPGFPPTQESTLVNDMPGKHVTHSITVIDHFSNSCPCLYWQNVNNHLTTPRMKLMPCVLANVTRMFLNAQFLYYHDYHFSFYTLKMYFKTTVCKTYFSGIIL